MSAGCLPNTHQHVEVCYQAGRAEVAAEHAALLAAMEVQLAEPYDRLRVEWSDGMVEYVDVVTVASIRQALHPEATP